MTGLYNQTVDVLVAGAGVAGLMAGIAAAMEGASVLLVEKQPIPGGSSYISGGFFAFAGTDEQREADAPDSGERLRDDLLAVGGGLSDPALVDLFVQHQHETYEFLKALRVHFSPPVLSSGQSTPRSHQTYMPYLIETLEREYRACDGTALHWDTALTGLIRDETGRVVGATVRDKAGAVLRVAARRGVVLASGGFSRNPDLIAQYAPDQANALRIGGAGNTGDGLLLAQAAGATLKDMDQVKGTFGCHPAFSGTEQLILLAYYAGAIIINTQGRRFVDESLSYKLLGNACLSQPGGIAFEVFDERVMAKSQPNTEMFDFRDIASRGYITTANSLAELAAAIEVPAGALEAEVARYNEGVDGSVADAFGRASLSRNSGVLTPLDTPPFYAFKATSGVVATYCGVAVDTALQVIDGHGAPIMGLFAVGEIMGGFHGQAYMTGSSLAKSAVFGKLAGHHVAKSPLLSAGHTQAG